MLPPVGAATEKAGIPLLAVVGSVAKAGGLLQGSIACAIRYWEPFASGYILFRATNMQGEHPMRVRQRAWTHREARFFTSPSLRAAREPAFLHAHAMEPIAASPLTAKSMRKARPVAQSSAEMRLLLPQAAAAKHLLRSTSSPETR